MFGDEASFWLDGTLHRTWSPVGVQPRVLTLGLRKTAHVFGAVALDNARFCYRMTRVFNAQTFHVFLRQLVRHSRGRKIFLIIDNGPCHRLDNEGRLWLGKHSHAIELHRLPPYSPELNPIEGVWKTTRRKATHNRFFLATTERDASLRHTFAAFKRRPRLIDGHLVRFR
jgi:transposase